MGAGLGSAAAVKLTGATRRTAGASSGRMRRSIGKHYLEIVDALRAIWLRARIGEKFAASASLEDGPRPRAPEQLYQGIFADCWSAQWQYSCSFRGHASVW